MARSWVMSSCVAAMTLVGASSLAEGQPVLQWEAVYDGPVGGEDDPLAAAVGPDGSIVVVGDSMGTGGYGWAVIKYDADGNELWVRRHDGLSDSTDSASIVRIDASGGVYVGGAMDGLAALVKYSSAGDLQWLRQPGGGVGVYRVVDILLGEDGMVLCTGDERSHKPHVFCYEEDGTERWHDEPAPDSENGMTGPGLLGPLDDGSVIFRCSAYRPPDFGDIVLVRYNPMGQAMWRRSFAFGEVRGSFAEVDAYGNIYCVASNTSAQEVRLKIDAYGDQVWRRSSSSGRGGASAFAFGVGQFFTAGNFNTGHAVRKFSQSTGALVWAVPIPDWFDENRNRLGLDSEGGVYAAPGYPDPITVKLDPDGNESWSFAHQSPHGKNLQFYQTLGVDEVLLLGSGSDVPMERSFFVAKYGPSGSCAADFNGDGVVDTRDFVAFLNAWAASDPSADFDGNGVIDTRDFIAYLNLWAAGC